TPSSLSSASGAPAHDQPQQVVVVPVQRYFTFDHVFGTNATQEEIYQGSVKRMVDKFMEGYNVTIMAYGQTSSGKTYTMGTGAPSSEDRGSPSEGIIPRAVAQLFHDARKPPPVYPGYKIPPLKTSFRVSFVEIYNEDLIDLLAKGDFRPPVTIREDTKGNIFWTGVQEIAVASVEEVIHLLWYGSQNRQTHSTEMNEKSSRSHAIFSITLRQEKFVPTHPPPPLPVIDSLNSPTLSKNAHPRSPSLSNTTSIVPGSPASIRPGTPTTMGASSSKLKRQSTLSDITALTAPSTPISTANDDPEPDGEWVVLNSKFHFVDLAGSERLKRTSAIGDRAKEGISINAGLHALGNVISALGDPSKKASHVPYRDSKLTRLLQDSLGGNALALMIACVSPSEINLNETLNTLKYANRARNIKNSSTLNQEVNMDNPEYLRSIIQKLKMEIKMLK
ncbi:P-loop containing nucleoside triphosphate hydrolase protein, partial [Lobosporangium transversale]